MKISDRNQQKQLPERLVSGSNPLLITGSTPSLLSLKGYLPRSRPPSKNLHMRI